MYIFLFAKIWAFIGFSGKNERGREKREKGREKGKREGKNQNLKKILEMLKRDSGGPLSWHF